MSRIVLLGLVLAALATTAVSAASPPPGATARCRDGSYSFSQHRSGTCSHHGGVAAWLGSATAASSPARAARPSASRPAVRLGRTVLLGRRTKTRGCALGPRPDPTCSPGAYDSGLTTSVICAPGFRTAFVRNVPESEKAAVEAEYGLEPGRYGRELEIDHVVPLELGGSNDMANLFPERAAARPGYRVKDRLENRLHDLVCAGRLSLAYARQAIARDWEALYRKVFGVRP
ncbi:MAG TPA: DUF3761 domain-containing protein [Gaiellaceae bacterium]|nr:DUF3761 domain-containing protein [Gaiellaceae bacterium]